MYDLIIAIDDVHEVFTPIESYLKIRLNFLFRTIADSFSLNMMKYLANLGSGQPLLRKSNNSNSLPCIKQKDLLLFQYTLASITQLGR